jgi:2-polyprenyl-6-methoxyphenol hydroxylase-like FAD-dependent oxidoreductase
VALIGDAAHAMSSSSGQGASMALEDAFFLAKCLRDIPDVEQAFTAFEQLRKERVMKMLEMGLNGDRGKFSKGPFQVWMRDMMRQPFF